MDPRRIVFQSAGLGRSREGHVLGIGPYAVRRIDLDRGDIETLAEDPSQDFLGPRLAADGSLLYVRRPWVGARGASFWAATRDFVLFPVRLLYAIFQYLNFFTARYAGKPLTTAGGPKQEADARRMMVWGNLVEATASEQPDDDTPGVVPASWVLERRRADGRTETVARGVLSFDVAPDGSLLAAKYGTPLYIYDRTTLDASVAQYHSAVRKYYPVSWRITYAGKAFLCKAVAGWAQTSGLLMDCTGEGEIAIALAAGVSPENILVHGVNKSTADLNAALQHAGTIVIDNVSELHQLQGLLSNPPSPIPDLWLRLLPGVAVHTHHTHTQTGQHDSKFGMTREEILEAARFCRNNHLPLKGIHFHQGSNFRDPEPLIPAIDMALDLSKEIGFGGEWHFCPGGGWGMAYHEDELPNPSFQSYVRGIGESVIEGCRSRGLDLPQLHLEPGRSLIARAGVALYRVGAVKKRPGKTWLLIDGGMADNPRFALYGARYTCLPVAGVGREGNGKVSIAGPYCESGDILIEDLSMPDIQEGELITIPVAGAYQLSMSSNYNGARRPAVLWLEGGQAKLIQKRETMSDLLRRDAGL